MTITDEDRAAIHELIAQHGHLCDSGELERLDEVLTTDVVYDISDIGQPPLHGVDAVVAAGRTLGEQNPVGHHVTNTVLAAITGDQVQAQSKGIAIMTNGTAASVTYEDVIVRTTQGWRISHRKTRLRRVPLQK